MKQVAQAFRVPTGAPVTKASSPLFDADEEQAACSMHPRAFLSSRPSVWLGPQV